MGLTDKLHWLYVFNDHVTNYQGFMRGSENHLSSNWDIWSAIDKLTVCEIRSRNYDSMCFWFKASTPKTEVFLIAKSDLQRVQMSDAGRASSVRCASWTRRWWSQTVKSHGWLRFLTVKTCYKNVGTLEAFSRLQKSERNVRYAELPLEGRRMRKSSLHEAT